VSTVYIVMKHPRSLYYCEPRSYSTDGAIVSIHAAKADADAIVKAKNKSNNRNYQYKTHRKTVKETSNA
jgi:hypothetical protein